MAKTYLIKIEDEETWREFHSICVLLGISLKDMVWSLIGEFVKKHGQRKENGKESK